MKNKQYQIIVNNRRQSISVSPLTMQFITSEQQFQNVARSAINLFFELKHWGEDEQPQGFDDRITWLCERYDVSIPEMIRTAIAWRDGYNEAHSGV